MAVVRSLSVDYNRKSHGSKEMAKWTSKRVPRGAKSGAIGYGIYCGREESNLHGPKPTGT